MLWSVALNLARYASLQPLTGARLSVDSLMNVRRGTTQSGIDALVVVGISQSNYSRTTLTCKIELSGKPRFDLSRIREQALLQGIMVRVRRQSSVLLRQALNS